MDAHTITIYSLPVVAALIGWVTNYIAVKMLFHPRIEKRFLGIKIQGVFPKRQAVFAEKLGLVVANELISAKDFTNKFQELVLLPDVQAKVSKAIEDAITQRLPKALPMLAMFMSPEIVVTVRDSLLVEVNSMLGEMSQFISKRIESELDVATLVKDKVAAFSSDKLEEILFAIMSKEFRFIELVGGVLGFLIGLTQLAIGQL